ncbi:unnamed protein product, partial [Rotaria sp. Silwood2]
WLFKLQDLLPQIIAVKHRAGATNAAADYISRHFPPSESTNINSSTINVTNDDWSIGTEHCTDVIIQQIIQQIRNNRRYESFIIQHGILYKLATRADTTIKLVYAPLKLIPEIMAAYHDHPSSGHFGTGRTWSMLRNTYYWPRMKETIISYIKSCDKCSQFNVDRHKPPGF